MIVTEEIDGDGLNNSRRTLFVSKEGYSSADVCIEFYAFLCHVFHKHK